MICRLLPILCAGAGLILAGCADDDPRSGGFFGGLFGLGSGAYAKRVEDEKAGLKTEEVRYQEELAGRDSLDQTLEERRAEAADLEGQITSLRESVEGLDTEITRLRDERSTTQDEVERTEATVALLVDDIDRIETERDALEQAKALGADADQDTDPLEFGEPPREQVSDLRAYINQLQEAVEALKAARAERAGEGLTPSGSDSD